MVFDDLRQFIKFLKDNNDLAEVNEKVDPILEAAEITDRVVKMSGPALLFNNMAGCSIPYLTNIYGTEKRMLNALGVNDYSEITGRIENFLKPPEKMGIIDKMTQVPKLFELSRAFPETGDKLKAPCKEIILKDDECDLGVFPVIKCWPDDGGKFITLPVVITKNPITGVQNCGMYRMQVFSKNTTGMHWHKHKDGAYIAAIFKENGNLKVPVSVALGADPAVTFAAAAPLPQGIDEMIFAGFLRNKPVKLVKSELSDIKVPAEAEIILEGYVDLEELALEGPFGDHTGFYSEADNYPVFHVKCITMRKNPIYLSTIVGVPPMEDFYMGKAIERIFLPLLKMQCPEIIDISFPRAGVFHNLALVKIKKSYHGQPQKIFNYFWGQNQLMFTKNIVVFDENTDIHNSEEALFMMLANVDFKRDVSVMDGPLDVLDHASAVFCYGAKVGIDATFKDGQPGCRKWPKVAKMHQNIKKIVDEKWDKYQIKL
ncbi:MAG: menaquinone biosynthesis decarboxylase [Candidatus Wallbacteria bacterium]